MFSILVEGLGPVDHERVIKALELVGIDDFDDIVHDDDPPTRDRPDLPPPDVDSIYDLVTDVLLWRSAYRNRHTNHWVYDKNTRRLVDTIDRHYGAATT